MSPSRPTIEVRGGDISTFEGDAVVNAANNHLRMGAGVAGALRRAGGPEIQRQCDEIVARRGPIRVGEATLTGGGDLPARFVIHAATMGDEPATARSIREATAHALRLAEGHACRTLAFPVLGAGIAGVPFESAAEAMLEAIRGEEAAASIDTLVLYGYTDRDRQALTALVGEGPGRAEDVDG